ncbi:ABC transporter substrate-binding protein [Lapidilactobacillus wuchangensis]|uniref:ABC transporter substrate-binding protein n=1 Tax=Lapidilactobacillus wuchangensis TaxID=2486001 RepID=UPI000F779180|nr:extracellular solute-binding protein [Lapidilactobacillus wuchangensis]
MKKRLFWGLVMSVFTALLLSGCSKNANNKKVTLELFSNKSEAVGTYQKLIKEFEQENPDIEVKLTTPPDAETVMKTRLTKNDIPDMFAMSGNGTFGELARAGVFADFSGNQNLEKVRPVYIDSLEKVVGPTKKGTYGIPYTPNANIVIYNKDRLKELNGTVPQTWNEFVALLKKAKAAKITPIYWTLNEPWTDQSPWNSLEANLVSQNFAKLENEGKTSFVKTHQKVAKKMLTLINYGHSDNFGKGYSDGNTAIGKGDSLFYFQGNWAIPEVLKATPKANIGVFPLPTSNVPGKTKLASAVDIVLTMSVKTKHEKEVKKFINFMMRKENAQTFIDDQLAFSTIKGVDQNNEILSGIKPYFADDRITAVMDSYYPQGMGTASLIQEFLQKKNTNAFLKKLDSEWAKTLDHQ